MNPETATQLRALTDSMGLEDLYDKLSILMDVIETVMEDDEVFYEAEVSRTLTRACTAIANYLVDHSE